jgi:Insertion element 4 transposase N-terminal
MTQTGVVAGGGALTDWISLGVLASSVPRDVVDDAVAATGKGARRAEGKLPPHVMVAQRLAVVGVHAVQVTAIGCFTGTAACLPFAGQLLSQLGAPYNPRGHNLRRFRPPRHGD